MYTLYSKFMKVSKKEHENHFLFRFPWCCVCQQIMSESAIFMATTSANSVRLRGGRGGRGEWDEARTNYWGSAIRKGPGARLCCFRWYQYFSIVQIYQFRPGTSHSATKSQSFGESVKICCWSALAWGEGGPKKIFTVVRKSSP